MLHQRCGRRRRREACQVGGGQWVSLGECKAFSLQVLGSTQNETRVWQRLHVADTLGVAAFVSVVAAAALLLLLSCR